MILDQSGAFTLLGAIFKQAIHAAQRGDRGARGWLRSTLPEWRQIQQRYAAQGAPQLAKLNARRVENANNC